MTLLREKVNRLEAGLYVYSQCYPLGQGFTVLLSGPPGTGKTLTAEAGN